MAQTIWTLAMVDPTDIDTDVALNTTQVFATRDGAVEAAEQFRIDFAEQGGEPAPEPIVWTVWREQDGAWFCEDADCGHVFLLREEALGR